MKLSTTYARIQLILAGSLFAYAAAIWARVLGEDQLWQLVVMLISACIFTMCHFLTAVNWHGVSNRQVEDKRAEGVEANAGLEPGRSNMSRLGSRIGVVAGVLMIVGIIMQILAGINQ